MEAAVAALITAVAAVTVALIEVRSKHREAMAELREINAAVNHRLPGEPRLIELAAGSFQALGRLEGKFDAHAADETIHRVRG